MNIPECMPPDDSRIFKEKYPIQEQKRALRKRMLAERAAVSPEDRKRWDEALAARVFSIPELSEVGHVFGYLSYGSEIGTHKLIAELLRRSIRVSCPRVAEDRICMDFYEIHSLADCEKGFHGILEPGAGCRKTDAPNAVILVPGLAFTESGERLGYGGGFYDRFLARETGHFTVSLAYPFQLLSALPADGRDQRVNIVLTPNRIIRCRQTKT